MTATPAHHSRRDAYMLVEVLAYLAVVTVVLAVGYAAMYRALERSVVLHRTADDIALALQTGERWRADVRAANRGIKVERIANTEVLRLMGAEAEVDYQHEAGALYRRRDTAPWVRVLSNVKASAMQEDPRPGVTAWRWELELEPRGKGRTKPSRIRPLFTFVAVPQPNPQP